MAIPYCSIVWNYWASGKINFLWWKPHCYHLFYIYMVIFPVPWPFTWSKTFAQIRKLLPSSEAFVNSSTVGFRSLQSTAIGNANGSSHFCRFNFNCFGSWTRESLVFALLNFLKLRTVCLKYILSNWSIAQVKFSRLIILTICLWETSLFLFVFRIANFCLFCDRTGWG